MLSALGSDLVGPIIICSDWPLNLVGFGTDEWIIIKDLFGASITKSSYRFGPPSGCDRRHHWCTCIYIAEV